MRWIDSGLGIDLVKTCKSFETFEWLRLKLCGGRGGGRGCSGV